MFQKLGIKEGQFGFGLLEDENVFNAVELINHTLSWKNQTKQIKLPGGGSKTFSFDLDPISLYENSKADPAKKMCIR